LGIEKKMENYYFLVDSAFLDTLNLEAQAKIRDDIDKYGKRNGIEKEKCRCYVILCPYCNSLATLISRVVKIDEIEHSPFACAFCGESPPYNKIVYSVEKAKILYDLCESCSAIDKKQENIQNERVLLEQSIVVLATGIELYFKEIYILSMDLKYVKPEYSLHSKFNRDVKNDFLNIGKTVSMFKTEFNINIKDILGIDIINKLNYLTLLRNVIVHNNGNVDNIFYSSIPDDKKKICSKGQPVPISKNEILEFIQTVNIVLSKIEPEFDRLIRPELQNRISENLGSGPNKTRKSNIKVPTFPSFCPHHSSFSK